MKVIVCGTGEGMCQIDERVGLEPDRVDEGHWDLCDQACSIPHNVIEAVGKQQTWRWKTWVDPEDIYQQAWLSYYERKTEIDALLASGERDKARWVIRDGVYRYCRKEKAHRVGYEVEDEQLYTLKMLRSLLPAVFGGDVASEGSMSVEPRRGSRGGSVSGSDVDTALIDVRWGLGRLADADRQALFSAYGSGQVLPGSYGLSKGPLKRLQTVLGGPPVN